MSSGNAYTLVGLGEILWDMLPDGKKLGGAPANFAYHAQELGGCGVIVSCIGDDELGKEIMKQLEGLGLDLRYIAVDENHPTGTVTVELDEKGVPNFTIHENVAWDFIPQDPGLLDLAAKVDAVCFGALCQRCEVSRNTVRSFLEATRPDCIRVFDINIRQAFYNKTIVHDMLELSNVLKLNDDELPIVGKLLDITRRPPTSSCLPSETGRRQESGETQGQAGSETDILSQLIQRYSLRLVVLTKGAKGSRLYTHDQDSNHKGVKPEQIADTVGAGDAFTAAITLGLLHGKPLDEINEHANRVASFVCSQSGATPKLPGSLIEAV